MKRFALYEDFNASQKKYRVVAIVGTSESRRSLFSYWTEYPHISAGDSLFISHSMTLTNATAFLNSAANEWRKKEMHYSQWGMIHMPTMKFVSEDFTENLRMHEGTKKNVLKALDIDHLEEKTPEQIKALQEIFPEEMHNRRGNVSGKKFGF
jgi:hypothetical protein